MASSDESEKECPLCMEVLELDDINFYPCKCEYQICRFCWHRIRTNENGLCPACRQTYPEDPVNFKPLSVDELSRIRSRKKLKQQQQKQKISESRKHLANLRVLQKNLVYVVGLSTRIADPETLKRPEYFGKYGRIHKVVVGSASTSAQNASCAAYVTYYRPEDALRAIQSVNNVQVDGRTVRASLGTTKYCSSFLRNQSCHKPECMYLHDVAENDASFTKEDMHAGKHTEYELRLHEQMNSLLQQQLARPRDDCTTDESLAECVVELTAATASTDEDKPKAAALVDDAAHLNNNSRQSRNAPPRHRNRHHNRDVASRSSDRGGRFAPSEPCGSRSATASQSPRPNSAEALDGRRFTAGEADGAAETPPSSSVGAAPAAAQVDWTERLRHWQAQQQRQTQSLFTHDETLFPRSSAAAAAAAPAAVAEASGGAARKLSEPTVPANGVVDAMLASQHLQKLLNGVSTHVKNGMVKPDALQRPAGDSPVLSGEVLKSDTPTDWQAAFGFSSLQLTGPKAKQAGATPHHDDDLGFDPFSESSKGLADLLEQEQKAQAADVRQRQTSSGGAASSGSAGSSLMASSAGSGWSAVGGGALANAAGRQSALSPTFFGWAPGSSQQQQQQQHQLQSSFSLPSDGVLLRGSGASNGTSPIPPHFNTPPPLHTFSGQTDSLADQRPCQNGVHNGGGNYNGAFQQRQPMHGLVPRFNSTDGGPMDFAHLDGNRAPSPLDANALADWQEGLKALLPNVNVHFAPGLGTSNGMHPNHANGGWGPPGPRMPPPPPPPMHPHHHPHHPHHHHHLPPHFHPPPPGPPFTQPPPPPPPSLSVKTNFCGMPMPPRPSPPGMEGFAGGPFPPRPPMRGPPPPPPHMAPPGFLGMPPWRSVTPPPPPGFSPGQKP